MRPVGAGILPEDRHDEANSRFSLFTLTRLKTVLPAERVRFCKVEVGFNVTKGTGYVVSL